MGDSGAASKAEWVQRVLGVTVLRAAAGGAAADWVRLASLWQEASDAVDQQIAVLQATLRESDDPELQEIAEFGLNGVTGNFRVPLMAALRGAQAGEVRARAQLPRIAAAFREHIDSDERIAACDDNPFGVRVSIGATLGPALDALARASGG
jgi:hypothetical protein